MARLVEPLRAPSTPRRALTPPTPMADPKLLAGEFAVDSNGAASYTIPINLPPGINDLQPSLALSYNSAAGLGLAGVGWNLQGLGAISRVPRTLAIDGRIASVAYDASDAYSLNGQRLVLVAAATATAAEVYRTEIDCGQIAIPLYGGDARLGPIAWSVYTQEGLRMEFGSIGNSSVPATEVGAAVGQWALAKVVDRFGNYYEVTYTQDEGKDLRPVEINYTFNSTAGTPPSQRVTFSYIDSGYVLPRYEAGVSSVTRKSLSQIATFASGQPVLTWSLAYQPSAATGRPLLQTVTCPTGPITFTYSTAQPLLSNLVEALSWKTSLATNFISSQPGAEFLAVDLDADGITDFLQVGADSTGQWIQVTALLNQGDKTFEVLFIKTLPHLWAEYRGTTTIDLDGDGVVEIIITLSGGATNSMILVKLIQDGATWSLSEPVFPINGAHMPPGYQPAITGASPFEIQVTKLESGDITSGLPTFTPPLNELVPIELDGDGRLDLALVADKGRTLRVFRSNGNTFDPADLSNVSPWAGAQEEGSLLTLDIDGDGRTDLVRVVKDATTNCLRLEAARNTGAFVSPNGDQSGAVPPLFQPRPDPILAVQLAAAALPYKDGRMLAGDVNGDGLVDLVWVGLKGAVLTVTVLINTGAGFRLADAPVVAADADPATAIPHPVTTPALQVFETSELVTLFAGLSATFPNAWEDVNGQFICDPHGNAFTQSVPDPNACIEIPAELAGTAVTAAYQNGLNQFLNLDLMLADVDGDGRAELVALGQANMAASWRTTQTSKPWLQIPHSIDFNDHSGFLVVLPSVIIGATPTTAAYAVLRVGAEAPVMLTHGVWQGLRSGGSFSPADLHGTGLTGFVFVPPDLEADTTDTGATVAYFSTPGGPADLPASVANEFGGTINLGFRPLTDSSVYSRETCARGREILKLIPSSQFLGGNACSPAAFHGPAANLPHVGGSVASLRPISSPKYVVSAYAKDGPIGSDRGVQYFYSGARIDNTGRGWLGFDAMRIGDVAAGTVRETCFSQQFPYIGRTLAHSLQPGAARPASDEPVVTLQGSIQTYVPGLSLPAIAGAACQQVQLTHSTEYWSTGDYVCEQKDVAFTYDGWGSSVVTAREVLVQFDGPNAVPRQVSGLMKGFGFVYPQVSLVDGTSTAEAKDSPQPGDWAAWIIPACTVARIFDSGPGLSVPRLLRSRDQRFNPRGAVELTTEGDGTNPAQVLAYSYDPFGHRHTVTDGFGTCVTTEYDETHTFIAKVTQPPATDGGAALIDSFVYHRGFGCLLTHVDANDINTRLVYDAIGRLVETHGPTPEDPYAHALVASVQYVDRAIVESSLVNWDQPLVARTRVLDRWGRLAQEQHPAPDGRLVYTDYGYDSRENVGYQTHPYDPSGPDRAFEERRFDAWNRLERSTLVVNGIPTSTDYRRPNSFECLVTTPDRVAVRQRYGSFNDQRVLVARTSNPGQDEETTTWTYDGLGRVLEVTDPAGVVTASSYDLFGRPISEIVTAAPVGGAPARVVQSYQTQYDDARREATRRDALGHTILGRFDRRHRLIKSVANLADDATVAFPTAATDQDWRGAFVGDDTGKIYPAHQIVTDYTWDGPSAQFGLGRLQSVVVQHGLDSAGPLSSSRTDYGYDACGQASHLSVLVVPPGADPKPEAMSFRQTFTPLGELATRDFPNGASQINAYDSHGALATISFAPPSGGSSVVGSYQWAGLARHQVTLANGLTDIRQADPLGRLSGWSLQATGGALIESCEITRGPLNDPLTVGPAVYGYDAQRRLTSVTGIPGGGHYGYFRGDRTAPHGGGSFAAFDGHQIQSLNEGTGASKFDYDANGNLTRAEWAGGLDGKSPANVVQGFGYDAFNRLSTADGLVPGVHVACGYDHTGRRILKTVTTPDPAQATTRISYLPSYEVTRFADGSSQVTIYVTGPEGPIAQWTDTAAPGDFHGRQLPAGMSYLHRDHLGSVTRVSSPSGAILGQVAYSPFGEIISDEAVAPTHRLFTGHEFDDETGLHYCQARFYHPKLGAFLTPDTQPGGPDMADDAYHRYAYALHRPATFTDPTGHNIFDIFTSVGHLFGIHQLGNWVHRYYKPVVMFGASVGMIIAGALVTGLSGGLATAVGGSLIGAGISGCIYTATALARHDELSFGDWGIQLGIGAATGLIAGAGAGAASASLEGVTDVMVRLGTQAVYGAISGAVAGVTGKLINNAAHHLSLSDGLLDSVLIGAAIGGGASWAGEAGSMGWANRGVDAAAAEDTRLCAAEAMAEPRVSASTFSPKPYAGKDWTAPNAFRNTVALEQVKAIARIGQGVKSGLRQSDG